MADALKNALGWRSNEVMDRYSPGLEIPPEMRLVNALNAVGSGFGAGQLAGGLAMKVIPKAMDLSGALGESGAIFPKGQMPNPFTYEEQATTPKWLEREYGDSLPDISKPKSWDIHAGKVQAPVKNKTDDLLTALMNSKKLGTPGISSEGAYGKALDDLFQSETFPGSASRQTMIKRMSDASRQ